MLLLVTVAVVETIGVPTTPLVMLLVTLPPALDTTPVPLLLELLETKVLIPGTPELVVKLPLVTVTVALPCPPGKLAVSVVVVLNSSLISLMVNCLSG